MTSQDIDFRDEAVRVVDQRHGYTVEFAPSPEAHRYEYDREEDRLRHQAGLPPRHFDTDQLDHARCS